MRSCSECWSQVDNVTGKCSEHPDASVGLRWIFSVEIADGETTVSAMMYHEACSNLEFLPVDIEKSLTSDGRVLQGFRALLWTVRVILRQDVFKNTNYLEIKRLAATISAEGVLDTYDHRQAVRVLTERPGCPMVKLSSIKFDETFGVARVNEFEAKAVRALVKIEEFQEGEPDMAVPDPTNKGLRVCRSVSCAAAPGQDKKHYLVTSGLVSAVQWLLTASTGTVFFVTATVKKASEAFELRALSHLSVDRIGEKRFAEHMVAAIDAPTKLVEFTPSDATPMTRKRQIHEAAGNEHAQTVGDFSRPTGAMVI